MSHEAGINTGKQGGAPALPNNFSGKAPSKDMAPMIGGASFKPSTNSHDRGKDGTQG